VAQPESLKDCDMNSRKLARGVLATILLSWMVSAKACDIRTPRCQALHDLIEVLRYGESLSEVQMKCKGRASEMSPDRLYVSRRNLLMGIEKGTNSWSQLEDAYSHYVDEACGGTEVVLPKKG
jgi:hypothetical protein